MTHAKRSIGFLLLSLIALIALDRRPSAIGHAAGSDQTAPAQAPMAVLGVDCSRIVELGIDKQANLRAAAIRVGCGLEPPGKPGTISATPGAPILAAPANANTISGEVDNNYPKVTQSESTVWSSDGMTIVVNYNDSKTSSSNYSGVSRSTDGGQTFTRLLPAPFATGHGTNFGDPILVFNARLPLQQWFAGDLATGCGGQGIGLWTSTDGANWSVGACAHVGTQDDRESMWVDNSATSAFAGRMYISWNDFASGQRIFVTHSDDGTSWTAPVALTSGFVRNVQITGGPDGTVFVAAMNEGGGGLNNRTNLIYRSTDGGVTWTQITMGSAFAPPGDSLCPSNSYFARITPIWRHMGWGQPGVGPGGVVHYAFAGAGNAGDTGDIFYTRSTDNGLTWSAPIVLNTDQAAGGKQAQWMPSLSVTTDGSVHVYWYDHRDTTDGQNYEVWGRRSPDNGASWLTDEPVSSVLIPQPEQPDSAVQACYAGDYNYATAFGSRHFATWTDGRILLSGHAQQDVFFAAVAAASQSPDFSLSLTPSSLTIAPGSSDTSTTSVTSIGGFSSDVSLACNGQPTGVTCAFATNPVTPPPGGSATSLLTVGVGASVPGGSYSVPVTGTSGTLTHTATISLQVSAGSFTVTCSPSNFNVTSSFTKSSKCTVHSLSGFSGDVTFSCATLPTGVGCGFAPPSVFVSSGGTAVSALTLTGSAVAVGQYEFQAVGTGGGQTSGQTMSLRVRP